MSELTEDILGYKVSTLNVRSCVTNIVGSITADREGVSPTKGRWLACLNPHSYAVALHDKCFSGALHKADWLIPDGAGVVLASKVLGGAILERVTGSDVFYGVSSELNQSQGFKFFFLGSTGEVLAEIRGKMAIDYPNVIVSGTYSPPFKEKYSDSELDEMVTVINAVAPDVLWVGMTAPRQEKWIAEMISRLDVGFVAAIGAVFDFYAGRVKRSHPVFQRLGLEWLPRLVQQPKRLWRRMFISAPIFVWHVIKARFGYHPRQLP
jgi:N-acetylglucosaminyldiphosphoundecaprenol N-acetyl-beta-D-mannosaminyltransferase